MALQGETSESTRIRIREPRHYKKMMHNDDFTTMEFVIEVLVDEILFGRLKKGGKCSLTVSNDSFKLGIGKGHLKGKE